MKALSLNFRGQALEELESAQEEAIKCYRMSAEMGCPAGQFELGWLYKNGEGVKENLKLGVKWLKKAAEQGHTEAQYQLGDCYEWGIGVKQNKAKAKEWYIKAAERGSETASEALMRLEAE